MINSFLKMSLYGDHTHSEFLQFICALSYANGVVNSEHICSHLKESFNIEVTKDLINISITNGVKNGILVSNNNPNEFHISKWRPYKTEDCRYYENGNCKKGLNCQYIHSEKERKNAKILKKSIYTPYYNNKDFYNRRENSLQDKIYKFNKKPETKKTCY